MSVCVAMPPDSPSEARFRAPHPLAERLIARCPRGSRILEIGTGSGRNAAALAAAGLRCRSIAEDAAIVLPADGAFDAALSTHALLHGTPAALAARLDEIARALRSGAPLLATFGSTDDARFGAGERIDDATWAPLDGDERGVAHVYFDEPRLRAMLERRFAIERAERVAVDAIAGSWAHPTAPLRAAVHWFVEASRR